MGRRKWIALAIRMLWPLSKSNESKICNPHWPLMFDCLLWASLSNGWGSPDLRRLASIEWVRRFETDFMWSYHWRRISFAGKDAYIPPLIKETKSTKCVETPSIHIIYSYLFLPIDTRIETVMWAKAESWVAVRAEDAMPSMLSTGTAGTWLEMCEEATVNSSDSSAHPLDLWSAVTYYISVTISSISILSLYTCIYIIIYIYIDLYSVTWNAP